MTKNIKCTYIYITLDIINLNNVKMSKTITRHVLNVLFVVNYVFWVLMLLPLEMFSDHI